MPRISSWVGQPAWGMGGGVNPMGFASLTAGEGGPCITVPSDLLYVTKNGKHCSGDILIL
jgi:hypothetical protein